jgi:hypothetical protein
MPAGSRFIATFDLALNLIRGTYFISAGWTYFQGDDLKVVHRRYDVLRFEVQPADRSIGIANCFARIHVERAR